MSSNEQAIAPVTPRTPVAFGAQGMELNTLDEVYRFAQYIMASPFKPQGFNSAEAIVVAIAYGRELGLAPLQALQNVAVINGKPSVYGDAMLAIVRGSGLLEYITEGYDGEGDEYGATCVVKRVGAPKARTERYTVGMAKKAGLWQKSGPWQTAPERMLRFRARGFALRDEFGDCLKGLISAEEAGDYPPERNVTPLAVVPQVETREPDGDVPNKNALTHEQMDAILTEAARAGVIPDEVSMGLNGMPVVELTRAKADRVLAKLKTMPDATEAVPVEPERPDSATVNEVVDEDASMPFDVEPPADAAKEQEAAERRASEGRAIAAAGGVSYDEKAKRYLVQSGKETTKYKVSKTPDGRLSCTCPDFKFNSGGEVAYRCKHIYGVAAFVKMEAPPLPAVDSISANEAADLRSAFQSRGVAPAEWLIAHGIPTGLCEDATVEVLNLALSELYN